MSTTPEDLRRLKELELEQLRRQTAEEDDETAARIAVSGLNRGVLQAIGLPVDLMNLAASLVGLDREEPVGGYKSLARLAAFAGNIGTTGEGTFLGRTMESVGATAVPIGAVATATRLGRAGGALARGFQQAPGRVTTAELTAGLSGGIGAATARELAPESKAAEIGGEITGAILNPVQAASSAARVATRRLRRTKDLFTEAGQQRKAGTDLLANAEDPEAVRKLVGDREFMESPLTPAQASGDRGLMTLERSAARFSAEAERRYADVVDEINAGIQAQLDEVTDVGRPAAPRDVLNAELTRLDNLLQANVDAALSKARQKIDDLGGLSVVSRTRANLIVRDALEQARIASRVQESELWNAIPGEAIAPTSAVQKSYDDIIAGRTDVEDPQDIPGFIHEFLRKSETGATKLGGANNRSTVDRLMKLRGRILAEVRKEQAQKGAANRNKIRILEDLQDSILDDLNSLAEGATEEVAEAITRARSFSDMHNARFTRGPVGEIFGRERAGGLTVAPELTLERLIGRSGPREGPSVDALMRATGSPAEVGPMGAGQEVREALVDHVKQRFLAATTNQQGAIVPSRAELFLRNNAQLLERLPRLRAQLEESAFSQQAALDIEAATKLERAVLHDKNRNVAALYLNARPSKAINTILEASEDPVKALHDLKAAMRGDAVGEAGLKAAYMRELIARAELSRFDATGRPGFDANRFRKEVQTAGRIGTEADILSAEDLKRLETIAEMAQKAQAPSRISPRNLNELAAQGIGTGLFDLITRMTAANVGAQSVIGQSSGASLVTAGFTVRWARRLLAQAPSVKIRNILAEAVYDKDLFQLLLKRAESPEQAVELSQRLNAWLVNLGIDREEE